MQRRKLSTLTLIIAAAMLCVSTANAKDNSKKTTTTTSKTTTVKTQTPVATADVLAKFKGGSIQEFSAWVMKKIKYPAEAAKRRIEGQVMVSFVVDASGKVSSVKVLSSPDKLLSDEAIRVVSSSPKWTPAIQKGKSVTSTCTLPINFKL